MRKIILVILISGYILVGCNGTTTKNYEVEKASEIYQEFLNTKTVDLETNLEKSGFEITKFWSEDVYLKVINNEDIFIILTDSDVNRFIYIIGVTDLDDIYSGSVQNVSTIMSRSNQMLHEDGELNCGLNITFGKEEIEYSVDGDGECPTKDQKKLPSTVNNIIYEMDNLDSDEIISESVIIVFNIALILGAVFNMLLIRGKKKTLGKAVVIGCLLAATVTFILAGYGLMLNIIIGTMLLMGFLAVWILLKLQRNKLNN